jgi:DNA-binding XRE family transcriptional regulator
VSKTYTNVREQYTSWLEKFANFKLLEMDKDFNRFLAKLSKTIAEIRRERSLTQEDMIKCGFSYRHYQRLESGKNAPNLQTLHRLALAFKVDIKRFF